MSTVLVTGATGFLGPYLVEAFKVLGRVIGTARGSADRSCDLTDPDAVRALLDDVAPDIVIHAAALTDVDLCEREPALAEKINREATMNIVKCFPPGTALLYISTDQVYPSSGGPHVEGREGPVNIYGSSKLAGEEAARRYPRTLILRTNLFGISRGAKATSLVDFLIGKFRTQEPVTLFSDVLFSPLHIQTVAALCVEGIRRKMTGTFNLGSHGGMSKCDFALAVAHHLGLPTEGARPTQSTSLPARAPRPLDMRMDVSRIEKALGRHMPTLADEIRKL